MRNVELREYQKRALTFLCANEDRGVGTVDASEMGTGKTVTTIALICARPPPRDWEGGGGTLVVCPPSVATTVWEKELPRLAPSLRVLCLYNRKEVSRFKRKGLKPDVLIAGYPQLNNAAVSQGGEFFRVVLDEAQYVHNQNSTRGKLALGVKARHHLALTGTPIKNSPFDILQLVRFAGAPLHEIKRMLTALRHIRDGTLLVHSTSNNNDDDGEDTEAEAEDDDDHGIDPVEYLRECLRPYSFRRTQAGVSVTEESCRLPKLTFTPVALRPLGREKELVAMTNKAVEHMIRGGGGAVATGGDTLRTLMLLRQVANHPALFLAAGERKPSEVLAADGLDTRYAGDLIRFGGDAAHRWTPESDPRGFAEASAKTRFVVERTKELLSGNNHMVVCSLFTSFLDILKDHIARAHPEVAIYTLDGRLGHYKKTEQIEGFEAEAGPAVCLMTPPAGGSGVSLVSADRIIITDSWWNYANDEQAIKRLHRPRQKRDVEVMRIYIEGTIEESVIRIQQEKESLLATRIHDDGFSRRSSGAMTTYRLLQLYSGGDAAIATTTTTTARDDLPTKRARM